jgi:hypothetical protein
MMLGDPDHVIAQLLDCLHLVELGTVKIRIGLMPLRRVAKRIKHAEFHGLLLVQEQCKVG